MSHRADENCATPHLPHKSEPDAHGQAALILAESILHALIEKSALTPEEALSAVHSAQEIKTEVALNAGESDGRRQESLELLKRIAISLEADLIGVDR